MTIDSQWALQQAVFTALTTDATLKNLIGDPPRVYDHVPPSSLFPYVVIGEISATPFDSKTSDGMTHSLSIHSWDGEDAGASPSGPGYLGAGRVRQVMAQVIEVLDRAQLTLTGHTLVQLRFERSDTFTDADGITQHGMQRFRLLVQSS